MTCEGTKVGASRSIGQEPISGNVAKFTKFVKFAKFAKFAKIAEIAEASLQSTPGAFHNAIWPTAPTPQPLAIL